MAHAFPVPMPMDCSGDIAENWNFFRLSWTNYETGINEKDQPIRVASLITVLGRDAVRILQHLPMIADDRKDISSTLDELDAYFRPKKNIVYETFLFNSASQWPGESINTYNTRLRQLASSCDFKKTA